MKPREAVAVLAAGFLRDRELSTETVELYAAKLADINPALLEAVIHRLLERARFFPSIAEIRQTAAEVAGVLPLPAETALAIVREADVERPVYRRDGTYAYTEHDWRWPDTVSAGTMWLIGRVLAQVGESRDASGRKHFGWEQGFKAAYERAAALVVADLSQAALPPGQPPLHLGDGR